jgi:predicted RNase H-like HicB family nuclease
MCDETGEGKTGLFGGIGIRPAKFESTALLTLRYVTFNDIDDILSLNYSAVCPDFGIDAKGKTLDEALDGLKKAINHYINLAGKDFKIEKLYIILMKKIANKQLLINNDCISYYHAKDHKYIYIKKEIRHCIKLMFIPYYFDFLKILIIIHFIKKYVSKAETL